MKDDEHHEPSIMTVAAMKEHSSEHNIELDQSAPKPEVSDDDETLIDHLDWTEFTIGDHEIGRAHV